MRLNPEIIYRPAVGMGSLIKKASNQPIVIVGQPAI